MAELLNNPAFVMGVMSAIIFALTQGLKQIIKLGSKHITNERARRMVNATILLIPFALGIVAEFLYGGFYLHTAFNLLHALSYGAGAISVYGVVERFFKVKNPYDTAEGKEALALVANVSKDGKLDKGDISAVEKFMNKV